MNRRAAPLLALWLVACGGPAAVAYSDQWPTRAGDYDDVTQAWSRDARFQASYQQVLEVSATFKSPEWRAAHVERTTRLANLDATQRAALVAEQQQAAADHYEVELLVTTWDRRENDLHRANASWKVELIDDKGAVVEPSVIERDRRPENILRASFPGMGDFTQAYVVRFPRRVDLAAARSFRIRIWSERGAVEMVWQNARS